MIYTTKSWQFYNYSLLSCYLRYSTVNALERTFDYAYIVALFVSALNLVD